MVIFFFRVTIATTLSSTIHTIGRPVWGMEAALVETAHSHAFLFYSKQAMFSENENLKARLAEANMMLLDRNVLRDENISLKEILGRKANRDLVLSFVLAKPNRSLYDTLIVDRGSDDGIIPGQKVFSYGDILIGEISEVYSSTSKITLYSTPGQKIDGLISGSTLSVEVTGRGGGNFEVTLPREIEILKGAEVFSKGLTPHIIGIIQEIISDPRDPFQKILLRSPVNIQEIKWVQIERATNDLK